MLSGGCTNAGERVRLPDAGSVLSFRGVHFTPRLNGEVWAGPNAVPSLHREGYRASFRLRNAHELLANPGMVAAT